MIVCFAMVSLPYLVFVVFVASRIYQEKCITIICRLSCQFFPRTFDGFLRGKSQKIRFGGIIVGADVFAMNSSVDMVGMESSR